MRPFRFFLIAAFLVCPMSGWSQLTINEIMATNASGLLETDFYNFPDWIELYNAGSNTLNLANFYLSDDEDDLQKWQLPSVSLGTGDYYIVYCDKENTGRHTNFGLSAGGETIYLSNAAEEVVDRLEYGEQYSNISYGKSATDNQWYYCDEPTPGEANVVSSATEPGPKAEYSIPAGRSTSSLTLSLSGDNIRYSTNGSEPGSASAFYTGPVTVSHTSIIKTKNFKPGFLPAEPYANTYFINEHEFTIPIVSLSFTPDYFYDNTIGIYVRGTNGTEGNCGSLANWNQPWERAAYLEYFDADGTKRISQPVGVKVAGGCTRSRDQKSLSIYARSKYGDNDLDHAFFAEKPDINSYKSVMLRNSGNDQDQTLLRDAIIQALVKPTMDIDAQAYQPTCVYMNGEYFGIMNFREKIDEDYFLTNYNLKSDEVDFLEGVLWSDFDNAYTAIRGSSDEYWDIINFISANSLANEDNYNWVASQLDLQEYINYMTAQVYIGNRDWPGNNLKFWKKKENGKWRWILFDTDYGFGFRIDDGGATFESFDMATATDGPDHPNPPWSTLLFRKLLENENFEKHFLQTFITHIYSSFHPDWVNYVIDSLSAVIDTEIGYNQELYGRTKTEWENYLDIMRDYSVERLAFMPGYVESFFSLGTDKVDITVLNPDPREGRVELNHATLPLYPFSMTTYADLPLKMKALPEKGFHFSHWEYTEPVESVATEEVIESDTSYSFTVRPVFEAIDAIEGIYLNEIASVSGAYHDELGEKSGYIELYNTTDEDKLLEGFFLSDTKLNLLRYAIPDSTLIPAKGFKLFYADAEAIQGPLHTPFRLDESGESILLCQKVGNDVHVLDSISFAFLLNQHSFGKYPDGTGDWQYMSYQTPGAPNDPTEPNLGIEDAVLSIDITLYPNPSVGEVYIELGTDDFIWGEYNCQLLDITGRCVSPWIRLDNITNRIVLDDLKNGFYFIRVMKGKRLIATKKLVLQR